MTLSLTDRLAASEPAAVDDDLLVLPPAWTAPHRGGVPLAASIVPIVGAVAMWLFTGSVLSLWLAGLGPLVAVASAVDGRRVARRDRRRAGDEAARARRSVEARVAQRHERERGELWARHPDLARFELDGVWRAVPGRDDAVVVGAGEGRSAVRVSGGEGDAAAAALRARASVLADAPVVVPASAGIAVVGPDVLARAVVRALVLQLCRIHPPGRVRVAAPGGEHAWVQALPHATSAGGGALVLCGPGEPVPVDAAIPVVRLRPGDPVPPRCAVVVTVESPARARVEHAGAVRPVAVEAVSAAQAAAFAQELADRAASTAGLVALDDPVVPLGDLLAAAPAPHRAGLPAVIGSAGGPVVVDLVVDGPHAVVAGVTGAGKSELLTSWIVALCATHSPSEVSFLLADFKGGTAFDPLARLPHVTGVVSDLDGAGARRTLESLRAELRRREALIAGAGARDILDPRVELPRLVIVIDEFAALVAEHPELVALFTDVAARGRALGMHLIIGTQRVTGVVRDALLANCPLRISLRLTDPADSRAVLGADDAARLPGDPASRGLACLRRGADAALRRIRVALTTGADIAAVEASHADRSMPPSPWLPPLPSRVQLDDLPAPGPTLRLGLGDEPARQRQVAVGLEWSDRGVLVVGAPGSGRTTALRTLAAQAAGMTDARLEWVPADPEHAWDALDRLAGDSPPARTLVVFDDLDALLTRLPADYAFALVERLERVLRMAGASQTLVAASTVRVGGLVSRLADLFPHRLVLPTGSRADHAAAGGDPAEFLPQAVPGRARLRGMEVQVAVTSAPRLPAAAAPTPWHPGDALAGAVLRRSAASRAALQAWTAAGVRVATVDEYAGGALTAAAVTGGVVVAGDPEDWQRQWRALSTIRSEHALVIDAACQAELRLLVGAHSQPPYCEPGMRRAWLSVEGGELRRVVLPAASDGRTAPQPIAS